MKDQNSDRKRVTLLSTTTVEHEVKRSGLIKNAADRLTTAVGSKVGRVNVPLVVLQVEYAGPVHKRLHR